MRLNERTQSVSQASLRLLCLLLAAMMLVTALPRAAFAQAGFGAVGGVFIDAKGMLRESSNLLRDDRLKQAQSASALPAGAVAASSPLRKVSLPRLEAAVAEARKAGKPLPAEILHLAGLQQVRYAFFYPQTNDVVIAGPAEPWQPGPWGDLVGKTSGRPVLYLDDLIVALRYAFADGPTDGFLGCSIEPTEEGMRKHAEFVNRLQGFDRTQAGQVARGMEQAMGPQQVLVYGAPPSSRFALQMIAADYRLKRLALGHDPSPFPSMAPSYLDLLARSPGKLQPQHRWWFVAEYDAVRHTADRLGWEFEGTGLKVATAPTGGTFVDDGKQPKPSRVATVYAEMATRGMKGLIEKVPAFAELQNLVSLAVVSELIRQRAENDPAGEGSAATTAESAGEVWRPGHFLDEAACPITELPIPKQTPSLANVRFVKDRHWLFSTSGGVEITPRKLAGEERLKLAKDDILEKNRAGARSDDRNWWWD